ncbi:MAG TPA: methyltransferase domain-containing protein [Candidatus Limnocylindria bacterium]|nr:methyltransferase domain-containing protein [Candidatus Limnocylindria bacterium]
MSDLERERSAHSRVAETYAAYARTGHAERWQGGTAGDRLMAEERDRWLVEVLLPVADGVIVDVGCGDGNVARTLERDVHRPAGYLGLDLMLERIAGAREATPWARLAVASAAHLPLADAAADAMVASTLLSSLPEPWERAAAAAEMARTLRPGGRAVVYDLRYPNPGNTSVRTVSLSELRRLFPGWRLAGARTLTVLPPLARSSLFGGKRRYAILSRIPMLRSHLGVVLEKPR